MNTETVSIIAEVISKYNSVMDRASKLFPWFSPESCRIHIVPNLGRAAGKADRSNVWINYAMLKQNSAHIIGDTIPHEIAHVVCMQKGWDFGHGPNWRRVASMLGANPRATFSGQATNIEVKKLRNRKEYRYSATCGMEVWVSDVMHKRIQKGENRILRKTQGRLTAACYSGTFR